MQILLPFEGAVLPSASSDRPVHEQITMMSGFDYLEAAFVDLFGQWNPEEQSFSTAFSHPPDIEGLYRDCAWLPKILNRAFDTMPLFTKNFEKLCPWSGAAVFWCVPPVYMFLQACPG